MTSVGACLDLSGDWNASESGSLTETIVATSDSGTETNPVRGSGKVTIAQTGCSISYNPIPASGLINPNLTADQLSQLVRTGTVDGITLHVSELLALIDTVAGSPNGITVTKVSTNSMTGTGQVIGNVITINETGQFVASGTYSISGQTGSFTLTLTSSSVATFARSSSANGSVSRSDEAQVMLTK